MTREPPAATPDAVGFDAHVLTGKFQGTRTTMTSLLQAIGRKASGRRFVVYAEDPAAARALVGVDAFDYRALPHVGAIKRLLTAFPGLFRRDGVATGVFQYISPLVGRNIVFIHDILPMTHPHFFPWKMRTRSRILFSLSIRRAVAVLVVSEFTRSQLVRRFPRAAGRIHTVLNGPSFPAATYAGAPVAATPRYVLTVGRIERRKNIDLLIRAFARAGLDDVRLVVVGAPDLDFALDAAAIPATVEFRQGVDEAALIGLYRGASLFAYPSAAEGFGLPLLDATLFGLPVIASNRTAMPEVARSLATYFDPEAPDAEAMLAALIRGHFGDSPIAAPSDAARIEQARRFSWDGAADQFLAALDSIAPR